MMIAGRLPDFDKKSEAALLLSINHVHSDCPLTYEQLFTTL